VAKQGSDPTLELGGCKIGEGFRSPAGPEQRRGGGGVQGRSPPGAPAFWGPNFMAQKHVKYFGCVLPHTTG
jgi:hypothetical protein